MAITISRPGEVGGYDYKFINSPPDRLICNICHLPSRDPYLTTCCGHVFCKSCLDDSKKSIAVSNVCPVCREEEFVAYINKQADREIRSLHVMCTYQERGCEWQGELNDIGNHLGNSDGCQFEDVMCSNESGKMLQQQYLTSHVETECPLRKVNCQYCHITGEHWFIEGEHKEQCPKLPLPCPNNCTVSFSHLVCDHNGQDDSYPTEVIKFVPREEMEAHKEKCPLQEVKCLHKCGKILQRRYLTSHVETECPCRKVDCQYCHITGEHQFIEGEHKEQCPKRPLPCPNKCGLESLLRENVKAHRKECSLEMVECEYHNVGCEDRMMRKRKKEHEDEKVKEHLLMTNLKLRLTEEKLASTESRLTNLEVIMHQLINTSTSSNNLVESLQWSSHLMAAKVTSVTQICPVTLTIQKFTDSEDDVLCSDSFYSHSKGYKMCLRAYRSGISGGKGTHLSVFLRLMKGPYDNELTWPLGGKFEFKLLNQISDCEHHSGTVTYDGRTDDDTAGRVTDDNFVRGWGKSRFISNEDFLKVTPTCQYLKDDCIFFQVSKL
ncbi:TNF receptor-associated factor 4-like [Dysidea avara]|uniref:TNF receptor-associated factor 4-like n=1 Tax=Dysidea avara TaxID=196820 RepID=UPI003329DDF0